MKRLLAWGLLASISIPALAATWNPDPSLGNVDQHRRLYEIARKYCDTNFDPDGNMVGTHSKTPPNKHSHSVRESAYYAYGLLLTGDPADRARAQEVLKQVVGCQDQRTNSPWNGAFLWTSDQTWATLPNPDLNSAAFVGLTLADVIDLDRKHPCLDPDVRSLVDNAGQLAVAAVMRRNCNPGYTNIALLSTALAAAGEKLWKIPVAGAWADAKLEVLLALTDDGELTEYLSPTYNGVALEGAYTARKFAFSDVFAARADAVINHLWKQVALSYHAPTYQLGGPYLRAYGDSMLDYCALLKYFIYLGTNGAYPLPDVQFDHDWDSASLMAIADLPISARPEFKQPHIPWRQWTALGSPGVGADSDNSLVRHLSQYRTDTFTLGTVAAQDEWKQKRNLIAFWRNPGPPPLGMSVGMCIDESNETLPGGFPGERIHFYSQQNKDAALVVLSTTSVVPDPTATTLVFDSAATAPDAPGASPFRILDGSITTYLYPVTSATVQYATQTATVHHIDGQANTLNTLFQVTRPWSTADTIGNVHLMAYLVVFRPADQPAPAVTGLALQAGGLGVTASAQVDGAPLSVSFKN